MTLPTIEQLLPCPFCGGAPSTNDGGNSVYGRFWWVVACCNCDIFFSDREVWDQSRTGMLDPNHPPKECFAAWNTRAPSPQRIADAKRIAELEAVIALIDRKAPRADQTCDEPGITLSEAARRELEATP